MANSPTSYLRTLAQDQATAFIASLQKVKEHLIQELQWINQQLQQKTIQLQGIDTLLSEATEMGLVNLNHVTPTLEAKSVESVNTASTGTVRGSSLSTLAYNKVDDEDTFEMSLADQEADDEDLPPQTLTRADSALAALSINITEPVKSTFAPQKRNIRKTNNSKSQRGAKQPSAKKTKISQSKNTKDSSRSIGRASQPGKISGLRQFVQSDFQDKSITESVTEIVDRSTEPVGAKDVMAQLYEGLSDRDYQRAKNSVTNVLSVGRSKGKWRSIGRGLYVSNAVATP